MAKTRQRRVSLQRSEPSFGQGKVPSARPARKTSLFGRRPLEGRQRPKKPGPSLLQVASPVWRGSPVRLRLPVFQGRLTGLLSRSPPTDTRPQARAYWAKYYLCESRVGARGFFALEANNFAREALVGSGATRRHIVCDLLATVRSGVRGLRRSATVRLYSGADYRPRVDRRSLRGGNQALKLFQIEMISICRPNTLEAPTRVLGLRLRSAVIKFKRLWGIMIVGRGRRSSAWVFASVVLVAGECGVGISVADAQTANSLSSNDAAQPGAGDDARSVS